jgi:hypothetical protein
MGLEQLERHFLGDTALTDLELRARDDDGTAGIVDTLAQQILTESPFLSLQFVAEGAEGATVRIDNGILTLAVVQQSVHGILEHPFLVLQQDLGGALIDHFPQAIVAVDDPAVQFVEVVRRKSASLQLNKGPKVRGNHRDAGHNHVRGLSAIVDESRDNVQLLDCLCTVLTRLALDSDKEIVAHFVQVKVLEEFEERLGTLPDDELLTLDLAIPELFISHKLFTHEPLGIAWVQDKPAAEIDDLLDSLAGHLEEKRDVVDSVAEVPDMCDRSVEFNVSHTLAANVGIGYFDVTFVTDLTLEAFSLELATTALKTLGRSEDDLAE